MELFRAAAAAILFAVLGCLAAPVLAHPSLDNPRAEAGSTYKAAIRITHGCSGSPVREVAVEIPEGVRGAKPMPKPGWTLTVEPKRVRWSGGRLENGQFDEFVLLAGLPDAPGTIYWKVSQLCEQGRIDWWDVPQEGKSSAELKSPAVPLEILPAAHPAHKH
jgi:periplasmic copper chaperone A